MGVVAVKEEFGPLLRMFRERAGRSRNSLCHEVGCDPSYGTRIEAGDREPPRLHLVEAFARGLRLSIADRNRLYVAAGYAPVEVGVLGWHDAFQCVADVLSDAHLTPEERDAYVNVIQQISARWRGGQQLAHVGRMTNGRESH